MKNLQSFGVQELNAREVLNFNGGTDPDGCSGCSWGIAFRNFLKKWAEMPSGGYAGMGYQWGEQ